MKIPALQPREVSPPRCKPGSPPPLNFTRFIAFVLLDFAKMIRVFVQNSETLRVGTRPKPLEVLTPPLGFESLSGSVGLGSNGFQNN